MRTRKALLTRRNKQNAQRARKSEASAQRPFSQHALLIHSGSDQEVEEGWLAAILARSHCAVTSAEPVLYSTC
jgi:hypothetical protein